MCLFYLSKRLNVVARLRAGILTVCIYKCLSTTEDRWLRGKSRSLHRTSRGVSVTHTEVLLGKKLI